MNCEYSFWDKFGFHSSGAFAKLRKATVRFVMSVRSHGVIPLPLKFFFFAKFGVWGFFFLNLVRKIQISLKSVKNKGFFARILLITFSCIFHRMRCFGTEAVEKLKTHILCSVRFLRKSCGLWDNVGEFWRTGQATDGSTIRRGKDAVCLPVTKASIQKPVYNI